MTLRVTSIDELDADLVGQLFAEATELMQERHPEVELTRGPFHDLVLYFASVFGAITQTNVDRVLESRSLLAIEQDPTLADPELVDHVLSNYRVTRLPGSRSRGSITVVVSENETVVLPADLVFSANGVTFAADSAFTGRPTTSSLLSSSDRYLEPLGDGNYAFTIEATAVEAGVAGNIRRGTKMLPASLPSRYVTSYATNDFSDGFAAETNQDMLDKLVHGMAAKTMGGRTNMDALIRAQPAFERTLAYSIVGFGDAEMLRDQHWIWPGSGGGRVDIYSRTQRLPQSTSHLLTATLVAVSPAGGTWQFSLDKDLAPGFYEVQRIVKPDAGPNDTGYEVTMDQRGYDPSDDVFLPDIQVVTEAAYTRYQTSVIRFLDDRTSTTGLTVGTSTAVYLVAVLGMPLLAELQDFVNGRAIRNCAADTLVKAPVPCFLTVHFDIRKAPGELTPDTAAIANALADTVNEMGFTGQLHASTLSAVVHGFLSGKQAISAIDMFARIRRPDGSVTYLRDNAILQIPDDPDRGVTGRTTAFLLDPGDVGINVITAGFTDV